MKTIMDKQEFAKLLFELANNYMEYYKYDLFYDISKLHFAIDYHKTGENKDSYFMMFFRTTGFDLMECNKYFNPIDESLDTTLQYRIKNNDIAIKLTINSGNYLQNEVITIETIKGKI